MLKRKAEGPPEIEVNLDVIDSVTEPAAQLDTAEQGPSTGPHTVDEHREGPLSNHLSPTHNVPVTEPVPDDKPFWELLALLGYEIW